MLNVCRVVLLLALGLSWTAAWSASRGLILSADSAQLFYLSNVNDRLLRDARQHVSLTISREQDPRNLLLLADTELPAYQRPLLGIRTLTPKAGLVYGNSNDQSYAALLAGVILRQPPGAGRRHEWLAELFVAPHLSDHKESYNDWQMDFEWTWGLRLQVNYPLPDQAELNLGFRKIMVDLHDRQPSSFDTGLFFGLSYRF